MQFDWCHNVASLITLISLTCIREIIVLYIVGEEMSWRRRGLARQTYCFHL